MKSTNTRRWNGHLFLYCHGARPTGIELTADLNLYDDFYNQLILEGWIVGNLSYRRGGVIINGMQKDRTSLPFLFFSIFFLYLSDAILDINNLREYVIKKYGEIEFAILGIKFLTFSWYLTDFFSIFLIYF